MLEGRARTRGSRGRAGEAVLSTWTRTAMAAAVVVLIFGVVAGLAVSGRLGDLRYANIPLVHPWPPSGYYQNPFNPGDKGDLINSQQAATVKADLLADGKIEIEAYSRNVPSLLPQALTGRALAKAEQVVAQNQARGVAELASNQLQSVRVGRLADPNDPAITWCIEEQGSSTLTLVSVANGQSESRDSFRFDGKFWVQQIGGRYLIVDVAITRLS